MSGWQGKLGGMTRAEMDAFLAGPWLARVACLKPDGAPYVVPVWYHWDGEAVRRYFDYGTGAWTDLPAT